MADKREVAIELTAERRAQIKSAMGQELTELKVGVEATPLPDRANPLSIEGAELEERANPDRAGRH